MVRFAKYGLCRLPILLGVLLLFVPSAHGAATCADNEIGHVVINEVYYGTGSDQPYVEIKRLDPSMDPTGWSLEVCNNKWGCETRAVTIQNWANLPWIGIPFDRKYLDFSQGMDVLLRDGGGEVVDYLTVDGYALQDPGVCSFVYDTDYVGADTNTFDLARFPDGTGDWTDNNPGHSGTQTTETSNDPGIGGQPLAQLGVADVTVAKGDPATFTLQLFDTNGNPATFSYDVTVDYQTADGTATAGTDYSSVQGTATIPAGSSSVAVSVPTIPGSPSADGVYFWLKLSNPVNTTILNNWAKGTISSTSGFDHIELDHDAYALTCQPVSVTVKVCMDAACTSLDADPVAVYLSPNGWTGGNPQTITGSAVLEFTHTTPETVTLGVVSSNPSASNSYQCVGGAPGSCDLTFQDAIFQMAVPTLDSCQAGTMTLSAVSGCQTAFGGATKDVTFSYDYVNPGTGSTPVQVNGTDVSTSGTPITLTFDNNGTVTVPVSYADAGQINLKASYIGTKGQEKGLVITGNATFVARPDHLVVEATTDGTTPLNNSGTTGAPLWKAGADFYAKVTAVCQDGTVTPNFSWDTDLSAVAPYDPSGGVLGSLSNGALGAASFSNGAATASTLRYSEVGNMTLQATATNYLGVGDVTGTSSRVGRFTPDHFAVSENAPSFQTACAAGNFTYIGEPFNYSVAPVLTVTAQNAQNGTTRNYTGAWWKITDASLSGKTYSALTGTLDLSLLPGTDPLIADTGSGSGTLTFGSGGGIAFSRSVSPTAPFDAEIGLSINVADADGISYPSNPAQFGTPSAGNGIAFDNGKQMRFGRLDLLNAYGSELLPLTIPLQAEYYDGNGFVTNTADSCTSYNASNLALTYSYSPNLSSGDTSAGGSGTLSGGTEPAGSLLTLAVPAGGNTGSVDDHYDLSGASWLRFDWNGDGIFDDPSARATFGIYKGNPHLIYTREMY